MWAWASYVPACTPGVKSRTTGEEDICLFECVCLCVMCALDVWESYNADHMCENCAQIASLPFGINLRAPTTRHTERV